MSGSQVSQWIEPQERPQTRLARAVRRIRFGAPDTKVFCVGFQKTATTSLGYALHLLGYRVAGSSHINRTRLINEVREDALQRANTFDAFQDMPWCLFFREFDASCPDAKFILTTRDPERWYASLHKHFSNSELALLEQQFYGTFDLADKDRIISVYETHIANVREHFSGRPGKMLEVDLTTDGGWEPICDFLGKREPNRPFPRLNVRVR
jgi:hypothetical protein